MTESHDLRPEAPEAEPELVEISDESCTVRALRAQVRALEEALEALPEVPAPAVEAPAVAVPAVAVPAVALPVVAAPAVGESAYRKRVLIAVRAVASRAGDHDDPRHAVARVVAAVERLDDTGFHRPVLPGIASRAIPAPPPLSAAAARPPVLEASVEAEPGEEVVLPVPPPAHAEPRRGRRRSRHTAA